jgi:hypothetical protein
MADTTIEDNDLTAIVAAEIRSAQYFDQTKRTLAIEYQRGEMNDLPARPNGSTQTDRSFADALAWTLPGVVRVFTASDQMVQFEATQAGGEQGSEEASEYTNYSFFRENDGYRILYNATYDSLLMGNGAACSYWCPEQAKTKLFKDKTADELAMLLEEGWTGTGVEPKLGKPRLIEEQDPLTGEGIAMEEPTYTVKLQQITRRGQIKDMTLKPENLLLNTTATTIGERFTAYLHDDKTRSDLMDMADEYGWDTEVIENLPAYRGNSSPSEVTNARRFENPITDSSPVKSGDLVDLYECYVRADADGDGVAELLQVWYAGNAGGGELLSYEEWEDDVPFTDIPCYPIPHNWAAESLFDRTADIQRVKTTLLRQLLDNTYSVGLPMQEVEEGSVLNPDALVNKRFGGLLWKKKGSAPIIPHLTPFIGDKLMLGLSYMDEMVAKRTGISKTTMALDPEALQNQTATGSQLQHDAGYSQIELIARNMAELGWTKFFAKRRNLAKKYIKDTISIPSKNGEAVDGAATGAKYRTIQPERWSDDMACTINVGLGTGSRDRDMAMLNTILNGQIGMADRLGAAGFTAKAIEFIPKIRKTAVEMAESSGLRNPGDYYPPITDEEIAGMVEQSQQPPGPPPELLLEQMKGENAKALKQVDAQVDMQTAELQAQNAVLKNQAELEADMQTAEAERTSKLQLEQVKQQSENARFFAKLAQDRELELLKLGMTDREGADGEAKPVDATASMLMDGLTRLGEMVGGLSASMSAPTEIVRGPDGRAVGTRKVVN